MQGFKKQPIKPICKMKVEKNVYVPMRDGVRLAVDIYRPNSPGRFPALFALSPYGKAIQTLPIPQQPEAEYSPQYKTAIWDGNIEAGDTQYIVSRGYAHVIGDLRGMGDSEGESIGAFPKTEGEDGHDLVEWLSQQPWCDGNVGGIGMSYFGYIQVKVALEKPPHLKAIAPFFWHDFAAINTTGIIQSFWQGLWDGRNGTSGFAPRNVVSALVRNLPKADLDRLVEEGLKNRDLVYDSRLWKILKYPNKNPPFFDILLRSLNPTYFERLASPKYDEMEIPVLMGGFGASTGFSLYQKLKSPKKIIMWSPEEYEPRPWKTGIDIVMRWHDHWLKGIDTGIMDEPPIKIFVRGANQWHYEHEWPLARTRWTEYYLRSWERLLPEPETDNDFPDCYLQEPIFVSARRGSVKYLSPPLTEDTEVTGSVVVYLYASIDQNDTNWRVRLSDLDENGVETTAPMPLTQAWLRASYKAADKSRSTPYQPFHTGKPEPVVPGQIYEYAFVLPEISNVFKAGHRIKLEISSMNSGKDPDSHSSSYVLSISRETLHKIYRDSEHRSRLLLPVIPKG